MTAEKIAAMVLIRVNCNEVCSSKILFVFRNVRDLQKVSRTEVY